MFFNISTYFRKENIMNKNLKKIFGAAMGMTMAFSMTFTFASFAEEASTEAEASVVLPESGDEAFTIGVSQRATDAAYSIAVLQQNIDYAKENFPNLEFIETDGQGDAARQSQNVEDLIADGVDLILISPLTSDGLTDAVQAALDAGIPVVSLDRNVECEVTAFIGADNKSMGVMAADKLAEMMGGKGNIIQCCGTSGASATIDRQSGFEEELEKYPDMKIVDSQDCDYSTADAAAYIEDMLQKYGEGEIQAIYCHNDPMAEGVCETLKAAGRDQEGILVCGMDGEDAAFKLVDDGEMAFSIIYPTNAPEGIETAYAILTGADYESELHPVPTIVDASNVAEYLGTGLQ
jgi:simple sugar transport system substrate-binding protein/ribose transport system substrate-binding protein